MASQEEKRGLDAKNKIPTKRSRAHGSPRATDTSARDLISARMEDGARHVPFVPTSFSAAIVPRSNVVAAGSSSSSSGRGVELHLSQERIQALLDDPSRIARLGAQQALVLELQDLVDQTVSAPGHESGTESAPVLSAKKKGKRSLTTGPPSTKKTRT